MTCTKSTGNDWSYLYANDGQRMLSWYFQEDNHVLQLRNTYPSGHVGNVCCAVRWSVILSSESCERWQLQGKLSDTSNTVKNSATIPQNSQLTSQIRAAKQSTAGPTVVLSLEFNSTTRHWKSASILEGLYYTKGGNRDTFCQKQPVWLTV